LHGAATWTLRNVNNWKFLKCGAREDQLDGPCKKCSITRIRGGEEYPAYNKKKGRKTGLVTCCVGTASKTQY